MKTTFPLYYQVKAYVVGILLVSATTVAAQTRYALDDFPYLAQFDRTKGVDEDAARKLFYEELGVFADKNGTATLEQVRNNDNLFSPNRTKENYESQFVHWAKLELRGHSQQSDDYLFYFGNDTKGSSWEHIDAWLVQEDSLIAHYTTGNAISNENKPIPSEFNFVRFNIQQQENVTLYVRLEGIGNRPKLAPKALSFYLIHEEFYSGAFDGYPFQGYFLEEPFYPFQANAIVNHRFYLEDEGDATIDFIATNWDDFQTYDAFDIEQEADQIYWLKTQIISNPFLVGQQLLNVSYHSGEDRYSFDYVDAYISDGSGTFKHQRTGDNISQSKRAYPFWGNFIPFHIYPGDTLTIYMRLEGADKQLLMSNMLLYHIDSSSLFPSQVQQAWFYGGFYAVIAVQFIFFLLLFLIERERTHFYFCLILLGVFIAFACDEENFEHFVVFSGLRDWHIFGHYLGLFLSLAGILKFTETYFNYDKKNIYSRILIPLFIISYALVTIFASLKANHSVGVGNFSTDPSLMFAMVGLLFSFYLALKAPPQKGYSKLFFFIAFVPGFLCGILLFSLPLIGKPLDLDYAFFFKNVNYIFKLTIIGFLTLLALSIGFRTNRLREDQRLAIQLSKKNKLIEFKNNQNELLLKEIHHRVKNNLEVVSSLLELQSAQMKDTDVQQLMQASQNRVQSMGILHQKLYQGKNLASVEMKDYFKNLSENLFNTYAVSNSIKIEYNMEEIELDIDTAIPIGLIVNELLTNALKYAFPDGEQGYITLSLEQKSKHRLQLIVEDDGIGKAKNAVIQGTGFGSQLIQLLTRQLNGTMREEVVNGARFVFNFKHKIF